jgi:uncharacterized low-complexity protein
MKCLFIYPGENPMSKKTLITTAIGSAFVASMAAAPIASAAENPFALSGLSSGYQVADNHAAKPKEGKCGEGKCGAKDAKAKEGKCGEGKCGTKAKGDANKAEAGKTSSEKMKDGKCGEGKCGAKK